MKGHPDVIKALNALLADEYGAAIQYGIHAERFANLGFPDAAKAARARQASESEHAAELVERIVFFEGEPATAPTGVKTAADPAGMLAADLESEMRAQRSYAKAIRLSLDKDDFGTVALLTHILGEEESHINYIEAQRAAVKVAGASVGLLALGEAFKP